MNDKPRLIDADALKKELDAWASPIRNRKFYVRDDAICVIDAAPTVDAVPVVHVARIKLDIPESPTSFFEIVCPKCDSRGFETDKYCAGCGAKLDGKDGE